MRDKMKGTAGSPEMVEIPISATTRSQMSESTKQQTGGSFNCIVIMAGLTSKHSTHVRRAPGWKGAPERRESYFDSNSFLLFGPQTTVENFIKIEPELLP